MAQYLLSVHTGTDGQAPPAQPMTPDRMQQSQQQMQALEDDRIEPAVEAYDTAAALAPSPAERDYLAAQAAALGVGRPSPSRRPVDDRDRA